MAGAHKLARVIWAMVVSGQPYDEAKAFDSSPAATARRTGHTPSKRHLALLAWSLFVTNVPATRLTLAHLAVFRRTKSSN